MRRDEIQILNDIQKLTISQLYLLQAPQSPQQEFLHLFGHRTLVTRNIFHRNIDRVRLSLPGSFAHAALETAVLSSFIENQVDCTEEKSPLLDLIQGWVNYYPALRTAKKEKRLLIEAVLQQGLSGTSFGGFAEYLTYLNIISIDLWRLLRNKKSEQEFLTPKPIREDIKEALEERCGKWLDTNDLLTFVSGCIPKTLLNIILTPDGIPSELSKRKNLECLFSNQAVQYFLRRYTKLGLLLRHILVVIVTMQLSAVQQKFFMLVVMRYFYVYHFDRQYASAELVVHAFNKLGEEVKRQLADEFSLFFKIILKLGKHKFTNFVAQRSAFARQIIELVMKKPMIGYPQQSANPYNTANVAEIIQIQRGATASRTFQVLQDHSIFYFRIKVVSLDITIRLIYLGQVGTTKKQNKILFTNQNVQGQLKTSVIATRKGLYRFQFDNSSSWINGKKIRYQNEVFTPLEIKTNTMDDWLDDFYCNVPLNELANEEDMIVVESRQPQQKDQTKEEGQSQEEVAIVSRKQGILKVVIKSRRQEYIFQTDSIERMVQRVNQLANNKEKYRWQIAGKVVENFTDVESFFRGEQQTVIEQQREQKREKIDLLEYKEQSQDQEQYQVTQKAELQRSQIINESQSSSSLPKRSSMTTSQQIPTKVSSNPQIPSPKKQTISYTSQELEQTN